MPNLEIKELVEEVLGHLPKNIKDSEDVIDDVFHGIETNPAWRQMYNQLQANLGVHTLNKEGGWWVAKILEKRGYQKVSAIKSTLIQTYSKIR